ncbi:aldo/keto reductase [Marinobacterium nitratireducens]|uniref:Aldo/keto reductase n=1 Tax=Marinobacterium nitratireducens TaxID=518897 RepID=A0A917ZRT0_9GAMM|nr:aldo/keto reductase [Marinobacterium nitratireducens]GGO88417.1 aldo/keto reductase [Marinobacterium nitratireducens]
MRSIDRRTLLASALASLGWLVLPRPVRASVMHARTIPSSGEAIPAIGMGTWLTFDVGADASALAQRAEVLRTFFMAGGGLIDSSPMYGSSEEAVGRCLELMGYPGGLFSATKVWTPLEFHGRMQIEHSFDLWGLERFDLIQVHNLVAWQQQLETLRGLKADGRLRYIGVTTSHGRRHDELEAILRSEPLDFVQLTYNVLDREAEARLLPLAAERGVAVIVNRPFQRGGLFHRFARYPLPPWAVEIEAGNWAQFFLKYILSHPAVTCAIPATRRVDHMTENMGALYGPLPSRRMRAQMVEYIQGL